MSEEIDKRFEQTVSLFEAEATGRTNKLLTWFQVIVAGLAGAEVTAELTRDLGWEKALPWVFGISILSMLVWGALLWYGLGRIRRRIMGKEQE